MRETPREGSSLRPPNVVVPYPSSIRVPFGNAAGEATEAPSGASPGAVPGAPAALGEGAPAPFSSLFSRPVLKNVLVFAAFGVHPNFSHLDGPSLAALGR